MPPYPHGHGPTGTPPPGGSSWPWEGEPDARRFLATLFLSGEVVEIRAVDVPRVRGGVAAGYFDDFSRLIAAAHDLEARRAGGIYVTLNPVNPVLLARTANRVEDAPKRTTNDKDILVRRWMFVDLDAIRPAGISSTDAEHGKALEAAARIKASLMACGWGPPALIVDSGNGAHLYYRLPDIDPADKKGVIENTLKGIAMRFDSDAVEVDEKVFNASRITKLPGTMVRKGDSTAERPHRRARIVEGPALVGGAA